MYVAVCERRKGKCELNTFTFFHSSKGTRIYRKENRVSGLPLNQNLQKLAQPFLELWDRFPYQHQFLSQFPIHSKQLLTPNAGNM